MIGKISSPSSSKSPFDEQEVREFIDDMDDISDWGLDEEEEDEREEEEREEDTRVGRSGVELVQLW